MVVQAEMELWNFSHPQMPARHWQKIEIQLGIGENQFSRKNISIFSYIELFPTQSAKIPGHVTYDTIGGKGGGGQRGPSIPTPAQQYAQVIFKNSIQIMPRKFSVSLT
jgi:hypothetical protein